MKKDINKLTVQINNIRKTALNEFNDLIVIARKIADTDIDNISTLQLINTLTSLYQANNYNSLKMALDL